LPPEQARSIGLALDDDGVGEVAARAWTLMWRGCLTAHGRGKSHEQGRHAAHSGYRDRPFRRIAITCVRRPIVIAGIGAT